MLIKSILNIKILSILFFLIILLLGINSFQDYGIYKDGPWQRDNALFWYNYVKNFVLDPSPAFFNNFEDQISQISPYQVNKLSLVNEIEKINIGTIPSLQPTPLGIFCELFIDLFNIESSKNIFKFRHLFNFIIFFVGLYLFYKLIHKRYKSYLYSFIGVLFLFLTPRFFAESFYNALDIYFLSLTIANMYTGISFLEKPNYKNTIAFALTSALAFDTRIMAILSVALILLFFFLKSLRSNIFLKNNLKFLFYFIFLTFCLIIVFWPYLWANPVTNFLLAVSEISSAAFFIMNFYLGKFYLSTHIPSHYHIVWIAVTTPLVVITLFLFGAFFLLKRLFIRLFRLNNNLNDIWRGDKEMFDIYFFMMILLSLLMFINKGLGYSGWRHLYFIYPSIIMLSLYGFYYFHSIIKSKISRIITYTLIVTNLAYLSYWNYKFHPHQYVYFNFMFKNNFHNNFEMDYWGLSNRSAIEYIVDNNNYRVKIGTKSFASLEKSTLILNEEDKNKISITHNLNEADFVITNYMPKSSKDFIIDKKKYEKYFELMVDNKAINTVYKKIK